MNERYDFYCGSDNFMVAISCGADNVEIKDGARRIVCTWLKAVANGFEVENVSRWSKRKVISEVGGMSLPIRSRRTPSKKGFFSKSAHLHRIFFVPHRKNREDHRQIHDVASTRRRLTLFIMTDYVSVVWGLVLYGSLFSFILLASLVLTYHFRSVAPSGADCFN